MIQSQSQAPSSQYDFNNSDIRSLLKSDGSETDEENLFKQQIPSINLTRNDVIGVEASQNYNTSRPTRPTAFQESMDRVTKKLDTILDSPDKKIEQK